MLSQPVYAPVCAQGDRRGRLRYIAQRVAPSLQARCVDTPNLKVRRYTHDLLKRVPNGQRVADNESILHIFGV